MRTYLNQIKLCKKGRCAIAKRFTDTLIWEKEWFMKLSPKHKCLFRYIVDRCDASGVWEQNWTLASIYIGEKVDYSDTLLFCEQVEKLPNGKILVVDFINFQYGKLSEKCAAHIPIFKALTKNKLSIDRVSNRVFYTLKEKEMETEEEMVMEMEKEMEKEIPSRENFDELFLRAFDENTCESYKLAFRGIDLGSQLQKFRIKCDNDPPKYYSRDVGGLRTAFQYQLQNLRQNGKSKSANTLSESADIISAMVDSGGYSQGVQG